MTIVPRPPGTDVVEPVVLTTIRRGADGAEDGLSDPTVHARTIGSYPDVIIRTVTPVVAILIRSLRVFLQVMLGLLSAKMVGLSGDTLPAGDFLHLLGDCAGLSLGAAIVCALQNVAELLSKLDQKIPTLNA